MAHKKFMRNQKGKLQKSKVAEKKPSKLVAIKNLLLGTRVKPHPLPQKESPAKGKKAELSSKMTPPLEKPSLAVTPALVAIQEAKKPLRKPAKKTKATPSRLSRREFDSAGNAVCREVACDGLATTQGYCRLHYIKNWKKLSENS